MIDVIVYEPGKVGYVKQIDGSLKSMQEIVGGYIEQVPFQGGVVLLCNEDGTMLRLPFNRLGIRGTFFAVRTRGENYVSLTKGDKAALASRFGVE
jgi:hypothetical protein